MQPHDVEYYRARAAAERALAQQSENANVAAIHSELAAQYDALIEHSELRPILHIAAPSRRASRG